MSNYVKNYQRDVKKEGIVEAKNGFDYLSWAHAEKMGNENYEDFSWEAVINEKTGELNFGGFVKVKMTAGGKTRFHSYPILNHANNGWKIHPETKMLTFYKPKTKTRPSEWLEEITNFDMNNAQMRGMAKLFSMMTGIGLSLFTGEDLRFLDKPEEKATPQPAPTPENSVPKAKYNKSAAIRRFEAKWTEKQKEAVCNKYGVKEIKELSSDQCKEIEGLMKKK